MAIAYHLVFGCYGFWLPNDPRGSWSQYVGSRRLLFFGKATTVDTRRSLAHDTHDHERRLAAKNSFKYPPVKIDGHQALDIIYGIDQARVQGRYQIFALCVMPDHVHAVVADHENNPKQIIGHLKSKATQRLNEEGRHPLSRGPDRPAPTPWTRGGWCVYLDDDEAVKKAIDYVNQNPVREGLKPQNWSFVEPYPPPPPPF
ncbi:MAG: transposase [Planctomycetia bacterium]|jgi:REP element-mobilizing transposase RayT